ncbi:alpha/beta fold hydrolase [Sciscionella marina]|uniref:alpha/beta fold hydrolase n=1 Tax=Sciscionella marina TaxID=508770 RepID=UPI00037CF590|nr:alpha/beta hydrolase [Sciscionella marina]
MTSVHHRTTTVRGQEIFYREAGPAEAPAIVLLHGYPTSSFMFRELIPLLAGDYHVLAPDHLGFGRSAAPGVEEFTYTFDALAELTSELLGQLGLNRYALYVQDYGAPIGWRLALAHPERITAIVTQNGNGYEDGFVDSFWNDVWAYAANPGPETEPAVRAALSLDAIRWQYLHGVPDPSLVSPDTWEHDFALVSRAGNDEVQLALLRDYRNNRPLYPLLHEFLRSGEVPVLAVWGCNDEIFGPAGAQAFARDARDAEVHLIDGGHFLLESHLDVVAGYLRGFLGRVLGTNQERIAR